jgi:hypothetical protein
VICHIIYPDMQNAPDALTQTYIIPAVKSSGSLPENPQTAAQLESQLQPIAQPDPRPAAPLPALADRISRRICVLQANSGGG